MTSLLSLQSMNESLSLLPLIIPICQFVSVYEEALVKLKVMIAKYKGEKANSKGSIVDLLVLRFVKCI